MVDKRKIISNLITLSFSEFINKGVIFFTSMYLMRTILPEGNGILAFSTSFFSFFVLFVVLAFNTVGTREIAKAPDKIKEYTDTIISTRVILSVVVFLIYVGILWSIDIGIEKRIVTFIVGFALFANAINLDWVFQGMEKMKVLAFRQVLTSIATLIGFLIFVHSRDDLYLAAVISTGSNLINVSWLFVYYVRTEFKFRFHIDKELLKLILKSAIPLSIFTFSVTMLNQANIMIMEYYKLSTDQIGIFNSAFKIIQFSVIPSAVIQMAFYPLLSRSQTLEERKLIFGKYLTLNLLIGAWITLIIFLIPEFVISSTVGLKYAAAVPLLKIYILSAIFMYLNTSLTPALIAWSFEKKVMYAIAIGSILSLIANFSLIYYLGVEGAVYASIIGEFAIAICLNIAIYSVIQETVFSIMLKTGLVAIISGAVGYFATYLQIHSIITGIITTLAFFILALQFKIIKATDLKGIIKR